MCELIDVLNMLCDGINPATGEVFDLTCLTEDPVLSLAVTRLALKTQPHLKADKASWSWGRRNPKSEIAFRALKEWRLEQSKIIDMPAYIVFTDNELRNISEATIGAKEDLLLVKGISSKKYDTYADELYAILKEFN